jgi:phosphatidylglycerol:prolipoprotein diacylglycerol transferase
MALVLAEAYLHRLDPFAVEFPAGWPLGGLRWYGLAYLAGFCVAWGMVRWMARHHRTTLPERSVPDLMIAVLIGVLAGGRLGYALFYDRALFTGFSSSFPFWDLLAITRGGMSSHGGMIGVVTMLWIFAVRNRLSKLHLFDMASFASPPGLFLGRLANFVNGELLGRPVPADRLADPPWWSVRFPQEMTAWPPQDLDRLDGAVRALGGSASEWSAQVARMAGDEGAARYVTGTLESLIAAVQDGNAAVIRELGPLLTVRYPSQLIQAITDGPVLFLILALAWWKPRKPGVVGGIFLVAYGAMRIATEHFRVPDAGVALLQTPLGDLSRGQCLSVLMILVGVIGLPIVARREVQPIGGLVRSG